MKDVHPKLQIHVLQCGQSGLNNCFLKLAEDEYLHDNEVLISLAVPGAWPKNKTKQGIEGRPPKTEKAKELGIVQKIIYSECSDEKEYLLIVDKHYLQEMIVLAQKKTKPSGGNGQKHAIKKSSGKSKVNHEIAKEQKKAQEKNKVRPSWTTETIDLEEDVSKATSGEVNSNNIVTREKRIRVTSQKMLAAIETS